MQMSYNDTLKLTVSKSRIKVSRIEQASQVPECPYKLNYVKANISELSKEHSSHQCSLLLNGKSTIFVVQAVDVGCVLKSKNSHLYHLKMQAKCVLFH